MATTSNRTARDIALDGLTLGQQLKLRELADLHNIPDDDSLYWMSVMLKPDAQIQQQLDQGFDLIAGNMEHFTRRLIALEQLCQSKTEAAATVPVRRSWLSVLLLSVMGTVLGTTGFIWGHQSRPVSPVPVAASQTETTATAPGSLSAEQSGTGLNLDPQIMKANQDRLKLCLADGNSKCTFLIRPES